jgi:Neocarzinostatin family
VNVHVPAAGRGLQLAGLAMLALAGVLIAVAGTPLPALAVSGPSATVTPSSAVTDGQTVTISGSGFPADRTIQVEECAGTVDNPPPDNTFCDGVTLDSSTDTDDQGAYVNTAYTVYTRPSALLSSPATITCDAAHPCVVYVGVDQNNFSSPHAFAALGFSAAVTTTTTAPPSSTTSTTDPPSSSSTTSTTRQSSTTSTTSHAPTTTTTTCRRQAQSREPTGGGCTTPTTVRLTTATTVGPGVTSGGLSGAATTTTTGGTGPTATTSPSATTATTTAAGLHDSGGSGTPGLETGNPAPDPSPTLPLTGVPHAAGLIGLGGVAVALGGTGLRRRLLRPESDGAR